MKVVSFFFALKMHITLKPGVRILNTQFHWISIALASASLAACGGGGSSSAVAPTPAAAAAPAGVSGLASLGLSRIATQGGGECAFAALGHHLKAMKKGSGTAVAVRAEIVAEMRKQKSVFTGLWDGVMPDGVSKGEDFDAYLIAISAKGAWGGELEIAAAAEEFDVSIFVYQTEYIKVHNKAVDKKELIVGYEDWHYSWCDGTLSDVDKM